ncbi:MAG TPA: SPW repeat protein [Pseudonocardia sp.]|jgi:ABC-type molybdate transport system permease subunit|nr:SPW repeat protein [Pseudonocardia sp.]
MKISGRWQDWVVGVAGVYAALSPIWTDQGRGSTATLIVFGVLLVLAAAWSLARPGAVGSEYVHVALGVLLFISPWVFGYAVLAGASWTSWVVGVIAAGLGLWAVPESTKAHQAAVGH